MYLCYIDESGTSDIPGNTSHYVLAGLSVPANWWRNCDKDINDLKTKWDLQNVEIHTAWMLRPYIEQRKIPNFSTLDHSQRRAVISRYRKSELYRLQKLNIKAYHQTKKNYRKTEAYSHLVFSERKAVINEFSKMIGGWGFARLFAECIDKAFFNPNIGGQSVDEQAFEQVVSRFEHFLQVISSSENEYMGMLIHDNNQTVAKKLTDLMIVFHQKGTLWTKIKNIIETPLFVDSKLTCMVQAADLCSYSLRRYLENNEDELFNNIFRRADRKDERVVGVRHFTNEKCTCKICQSR
jgi:hypothetical protein